MLRKSLFWAGRGWRGMRRPLLATLLLLVILFSAMLLLLRYQIFPNIEQHKERIVGMASAALGQPMAIGEIRAGWDGMRPRLIFLDVRILDDAGQPALTLPRIENTLDWSSLPMLELRLHSVLIERPELQVRRDAAGKLHVAGVPLQASGSEGQQGADWLLHMTSVTIRGGRLTWQDDLRGAPPLVLEQVDLNIENRYARHRFALHASPPGNLASRLDVRGNFRGGSFDDLYGWEGQVYTQLDYADVAAWKAWVELPEAFRRGKGALRLWMDVGRGEVRNVDADLALSDVRARLAPGLTPLELRELRGRISWHQLDRGYEVEARQLALQMSDGFRLQPTDFYLRLAGKQGEKDSSGELRFNTLELGELGILAGYLPLDPELKLQLEEAAPQGGVSGLKASWRLRANGTMRYEVQGRFSRLSLRRVGERPGFSNLSGEVSGDDSSGMLKLDSRDLRLDAPQLFAEPVQFDTLTAQFGWQRNSRGMEFKLSRLNLANADLAGTVQGHYQAEADGPGSVDASVDMTRVAVKHAARYTPLPSVNRETHAWLKAALQGGQADLFRVRLRGDLRDFPFAGNRNGVFRLEARAREVAMEFEPGWPRLENARTELLIHGNKLDIQAASATTAGAQLRNVKVGIPDLLANELLLQVRGEAVDTTQRCLDYIARSPVNGYLDGFTEGVTAQGNGKLNLQLDIPLTGEAPVKVRGDYRFADNDIDFGEHVPLLRKVNGVLLFTEDMVHAGDINARIFGGPAHLTVQSGQEGLRIAGRGRMDLDDYRRFEPHPLLQRLQGGADWNAMVRVRGRQAEVSVDSDLAGIAAQLPAPFDKEAGESRPLRFELKASGSNRQNFKLRYGSLLDAQLLRQRGRDGVWSIPRGVVAFGEPVRSGDGDGIWIQGRLRDVALEGWGGLGLSSAGEGALPDIAGIDVSVGRLSGFGSAANNLSIKGSSRNGLLSLRLAAREINGDLIWQPQGKGKLLGRFGNLMAGEGPSVQMPAYVETEQGGPPDNSGFPEVDLTVDRLTYKGRQLGRLELEMSGADADVQLDKLRLINPDGVFDMSGKWQAEPEQTQLRFKVDISDAGKILSRSGYPEALKDGNGSLEGTLYWNGAPRTFAYSRLNGMMRLKVGKGRFLKLDAGVGRLLGVLSLQAIPRRVSSLDFTDVFSQGFQFESITGNVQVVNGLLLTSDMLLAGSAAKATLEGQVDLNRETQNLKVRVFPAVGDNVSLLSFAAGPAVGVGVLLANKLLRDPLDKLVSFEYNVTGRWADPKVEKVGQTQPARSGIPEPNP